MLPLVAGDDGKAVTITPVTKQSLPAWLEAHPQHRDWLAATGFTAKAGTFAFVSGDAHAPVYVLAAPHDGEAVWSFAGLSAALPEATYRLDGSGDRRSATDVALGWALGAYGFHAYRKAKRAPAKLVWPAGADRGEVERLAQSVFLARDLINTPAEDMGPPQLAEAARKVADAHGAKFSVVVGDDLLRAGLRTIHAVGRASAREPRLIDLRWGDEAAPKVTLVGKGVCFDTGGLDLKTHDGMLEMKKDMGGGAVTLGLANALMRARAPIRLRLLIPAVENSVAGNAIRPRDIVRTRSGKTVEIGNTDAEGRLILCDALFEADTERPDLLIDCATLTGAARVALGPDLVALFCDDDAVASGMLEAGRATGDPLWRMPLWRPYRERIEGKVSDLNNVAHGPHAGAIIAALYLAEFVTPSTKWAHLDLFATNLKARPGRPEGGEATGLRALYAFIRQRYG